MWKAVGLGHIVVSTIPPQPEWEFSITAHISTGLFYMTPDGNYDSDWPSRPFKKSKAACLLLNPPGAYEHRFNQVIHTIQTLQNRIAGNSVDHEVVRTSKTGEIGIKVVHSLFKVSFFFSSHCPGSR